MPEGKEKYQPTEESKVEKTTDRDTMPSHKVGEVDGTPVYWREHSHYGGSGGDEHYTDGYVTVGDAEISLEKDFPSAEHVAQAMVRLGNLEPLSGEVQEEAIRLGIEARDKKKVEENLRYLIDPEKNDTYIKIHEYKLKSVMEHSEHILEALQNILEDFQERASIREKLEQALEDEGLDKNSIERRRGQVLRHIRDAVKGSK